MTLRRRLAALAGGGAAPETMALSVALALLLGVFPVYGCPTLLCAAAAVLLRLNLPAMQLVNLLTSPLQLALLAPFGWLGGRLVHVPAAEAAHPSAWQMAAGLGAALVHAVAGWCMVAAPLGIVLWLTLGSWRRAEAAAQAHAGGQLALSGSELQSGAGSGGRTGASRWVARMRSSSEGIS
ncbi:MAG TPA: DUF2062 domain-containing protein [Bryobacteraceae bacterium]|nr:DUF2062 domain-containing protein [Bryobacteraceae bacterium]